MKCFPFSDIRMSHSSFLEIGSRPVVGSSRKLIKRGIKFSMNPLTLDDIFYYIVKKPIDADDYGKEESR